jgi:hypothetical protein
VLFRTFNAATGVLVGVFMASGYVVGMVDMPDLSSASAVVAWYHERGGTASGVASVLCTIAFFFTFWFLGVVVDRLRQAEGSGPLTWIALIGGVSFTTVFAGFLAAPLAIGMTIDEHVSDSTIYLVHVFSLVTGVTTAVCGPAFFVPIAILAFRTGVFPRWLAWVTVVCAVLSVMPLLGAFSLSGQLNVGNGWVGIHSVATAWVGWCAIAGAWLLAAGRTASRPLTLQDSAV